MKKNNKGFMLAEVIVTSTIIVTAMIGFYSSFNKLYTKYNEKNKYYNIDSIYATKFVLNSLLEDNYLNTLINKIFYIKNYEYIIKDGVSQESVLPTENIEIYNNIRKFYKIENMIIVEYDKKIILTKLKESEKNNLNETFKEYIDYVINYYNITTNEEYNYLLLTEIYDNTTNNYYYANLRVR